MRWRAFGASCGVLPLLVCAMARAEAVVLTWTAPPVCPQSEVAEARVRTLAGAEQGEKTGELVASVTIQQVAADRWSATLRIGTSSRVLEDESCEGVADAAIVIVAMALDPDAGRESDATTPTPVVRPAPAEAAAAAPTPLPRPAPTPEPASARERATNAAVRSEAPSAVASAPVSAAEPAPWGASLRSFGEWGMLPAPSLGGLVAVHAAWISQLVELSALALLPRDAVLEGGSKGGEFSWFGVQSVGCQLLARPAYVCAGLEGGRLSGTGFGTRRVHTGHAFWAAPGVEVLFKPALGRSLALEASAGLFIALLKPEFALDGVGVVHQPGPVSARLELGIGWH